MEVHDKQNILLGAYMPKDDGTFLKKMLVNL
jgi:hypothetical protein